MLKIVIYVAFVANILLIVSAINIDVALGKSKKTKSANSKAPRCGELEVPNSCINGECYKERNCSHIIRPTICVDVIECKQGCLCKEGYLRKENGDCVPKRECPQKLKCPKQNEVYDPCVNKCYPNTCESIDRQYDCPPQSKNEKCTGGCVCEPGYRKNKIGQCISEENCKKCTGPNEFFSCGGACDNVCETLAIRNQTNCDIINIVCNKMCYCVEGFARDKDGKCVPFDQCPGKDPTCGKNEIYSTCINGGCFGAKNCEEVGKVGYRCVRIDPNNCIKGCKCKDGYVRNKKGICISEDQCPKKPPTCGKNEIYSNCINGGCFGAKNCKEVGKVGRKCVKIAAKDCIKGCKCEDGYVKNKKGTCIAEDQCPKEQKCTGPNEFFSCGGACDNVCETLAVRNQTNCDIINKKCNDMCYCVEGHARDKDGKCVPFDQCPGKDPTCGKNEIYSTCINGGCFGAKNCEEVGKVGYRCVRIDPNNCIKGCKCKDGYVRNKKGICISEDQCPKKPSTCGTNEIYSNCINGGCFGAKNCKEVGKVGRKCVKIAAKDCIKGCKCKDGYVKNKKGTCISEDQCPKEQKCTGPNEFFACGGACDNICETLAVRNQTNCDIINIVCNKMCYCVEGHARDKDGKCVPIDQCPGKAPKCGKFEVADPCINGGCYDERDCTDIGNPTVCARPTQCNPGCLCKPGYLRDRGYCVPREKCPNLSESDGNESKEESSYKENDSEEGKYTSEESTNSEENNSLENKNDSCSDDDKYAASNEEDDENTR